MKFTVNAELDTEELAQALVNSMSDHELIVLIEAVDSMIADSMFTDALKEMVNKL